MTYTEAVQYVASLAPRGWRMGLDRMSEFAKRAGIATEAAWPRYVHVAGTNGKGSVTAYLQNLFEVHGYRTGAFFSPYVYDPRERIQFGGKLISEEDFARITEALMPVAQSFSDTGFGGITEFEFKTAIGFRYFQETSCQYVALEVGLGGRLDATNIVKTEAGVIVSIGYDHMAILGHSLREIAHEKAGIIKGQPMVLGDLSPEAALEIDAEGARAGSIMSSIGRNFWIRPCEWDGAIGTAVVTPLAEYPWIEPGIRGVKQIHNAALAIRAAELATHGPLDPESVRLAIRETRAPGRFEVREVDGLTWVLDGAHNEPAAEALSDSLRTEFPDARFMLLTNMVAGHEPENFYSKLAGVIGEVVVAPIDFHRAIPVAEMAARLASCLPGTPVTGAGSVDEAIRIATARGMPVLVSGSFYLVGDVGRDLDRRIRAH